MTETRVLDIIDCGAHESWRRRMISTEALDDAEHDLLARRQDELQAIVRHGEESLARYLQDKMGVGSSSAQTLANAVPALPNPLTTEEMKELPVYAEQRLYGAIGTISRKEAASSAFWTACHAVWIDQGMFEDLPTIFLERLQGETVDAQTRNFLRRTGGVDERIRGKVSVLTDCPIARAWWRMNTAHLAAEASEGRLDAIVAHRILHQSAIWVELCEVSVKRLTAVTSSRACAALLLAMLEKGVEDGSHKKQCTQSALRWLGRRSHSYALDYTPLDILTQDAVDGIDAALAAQARARVQARAR